MPTGCAGAFDSSVKPNATVDDELAGVKEARAALRAHSGAHSPPSPPPSRALPSPTTHLYAYGDRVTTTRVPRAIKT
ncbi:unnamed protein product [Toxocara canis]|uniref:DUF4148 domain-containing protein n=1 Tax=Toxocara canis TaxID=6265 RepID=A0A183TWD2_TOXCA|nr:unnamed protein product [Toxocara canis]